MAKPMNTVASSTIGMTTYSGRPVAVRYTIKMPDTINTSPWAKLIRRRMP